MHRFKPKTSGSKQSKKVPKTKRNKYSVDALVPSLLHPKSNADDVNNNKPIGDDVIDEKLIVVNAIYETFDLNGDNYSTDGSEIDDGIYDVIKTQVNDDDVITESQSDKEELETSQCNVYDEVPFVKTMLDDSGETSQCKSETSSATPQVYEEVYVKGQQPKSSNNEGQYEETTLNRRILAPSSGASEYSHLKIYQATSTNPSYDLLRRRPELEGEVVYSLAEEKKIQYSGEYEDVTIPCRMTSQTEHLKSNNCVIIKRVYSYDDVTIPAIMTSQDEEFKTIEKENSEKTKFRSISVAEAVGIFREKETKLNSPKMQEKCKSTECLTKRTQVGNEFVRKINKKGDGVNEKSSFNTKLNRFNNLKLIPKLQIAPKKPQTTKPTASRLSPPSAKTIVDESELAKSPLFKSMQEKLGSIK